MKVLVINGSPRQGNTKFALGLIENAIKEKHQNAQCETIEVANLTMQGCTNCDACKNNGGNCIHQDDTAQFMDKMMEADVLIFGSPVYWWGVSSQLKVFIDKFYSKDGIIQEKAAKKVGLIAIGAAELNDIQYRLISDQFQSICKHLNWELIFSQGFVAWAKDDLKNNPELKSEVIKLVEKI